MKVNKANAQSAAGGFHLRRQMASCVLSTSKHFQCLKTTCPFCFMQGEKRAPKSAFFDNSSDVGQSCLDRQRCGGFLENRQKRFS
jgi:DNA-binding helix-hairpin-helix protein with protein kinase domain